MTDDTTGSRADTPVGVGWTALVGAAARAEEGRRPDALFDDPWAPLFLQASASGSAPGSVPEDARRAPRVGPGSGPAEMWRLVYDVFVGRTPFIDDEVLGAAASGVDQFVLLGAGLDARAERLALPAGSTVFEVDSPAVHAYKDAVLARHGIVNTRRVPVEADLGGDWVPRLVAAGFDPGRRACWVVEGLLLYLDDAAGRALLARIRGAGPEGGRVVLDHLSHSLTAAHLAPEDPQDRRAMAEAEALMRSGLGPDPAAWCAERGLRLTRLSDVATELRAHGREIPATLDPADPARIVGWLVAGATGGTPPPPAP